MCLHFSVANLFNSDKIDPMPQKYPNPWILVPGLAAAMLTRRQRSFRQAALSAVRLLQPPLEVRGQEAIPTAGPFLLTINHYGRPGFMAWWLTFALSASLPVDVHWIMTGAWIFPGKWYEALVDKLTTWLFRQIAQVYGFTNMAPVVPYTNEVEGRARSVRRVLEYARRAPAPVIGLAPEGRDHPGAVLGQPPPGLGRFVARLAPLCQVILPAGIFEIDDNLCLQFGPPYRLEVPGSLSGEALDLHVSKVVMCAIAHQLPIPLRGEFG
jgi:1-acyl-sn-glycerol-3-phosphate acyltransferase